MSWAGNVAKAVHVANAVGATLTLRPETEGAVTRSYPDVHEHEEVVRAFRPDGGLSTATVRTLNVPRVSGATKPSKGEHAAYDGGDAGVVASVAQEPGLWIVQVGG